MHTSIKGHDQVTDQNPVAIHYADGVLPAYAKEARTTTEHTAELSSAAFADPCGRRFPIHTPGDALKSGTYYLGLPEEAKEAGIRMRLEAAMDGYQIQEDWKKVQALFAESKQASASEHSPAAYAMEIQYGDRVEHYYPIGTEADLTKSAEFLCRHAQDNRVPAGWIRNAAIAIKEAADRFGMKENELPEFIVKAGTERLPDFERAEFLVYYRKQACDGDTELYRAYEDLVKAASEDPDNMDEYLNLMADLDMTCGVKYGSEQPLPHEIFYSGLTPAEFEKFAHQHVLIGDVAVPQQVVATLREQAVRQHFGKVAADAVMGVVKAAADTDTAAYASERASILPTGLRTALLGLLLRESRP